MRFSACLLTLLLVLTAGCADDLLFASCPFDDTITDICAEDSEGAALTCVVEKHPQCPEDVCLSWRGTEPVCSRSCTADGGQCPEGSTCGAYIQGEKHFCVPNDVFDQ